MSYSAAFIQFCGQLDLKLTSLRREVLYILWQADKPLKAYEILDTLVKTKSNAKPPSVYRALLFFLNHGIVHKIESIQCYTLCTFPVKHLVSEVLMVCNTCHHVTEIHDETLQALVFKLSDDNAFNLQQDAIELKGLCRSCRL